MKTYIITFEVTESESIKLRSAIRSLFSSYCPIHAYGVAVSTQKTAKEVRELIKPYLPVGARLFIVRSGVEAAWFNSYGKDNDEWLRNHL